MTLSKTSAISDSRATLQGKSKNIFDIRSVLQGKNGVNLDIRTGLQAKESVIFDIRSALQSKNLAIFSIGAAREAKNQNRFFALYKDGYRILARNLSTGVISELGFIEKGNTTLTDVAIANGDYEVYIEYNSLLWDSARDGKSNIIKISGGTLVNSNIPEIRNLRREFDTAFRPVLRWNISMSYSMTGLTCGLWFDPSSGIDISGTPDMSIPVFDNQGDYSYRYTQTDTEYVAIACINLAGIRGEKTELECTWSTSAPNSPDNQSLEK